MIANQTEETAKSEKTRDVFRQLRKSLKLSQAQLAAALAISKKAVQSYEQGWRDIPVRILREVLNLYVINRNPYVANSLPCWEVMNCPQSVMSRCPGYTVTRGRFCWLVGADFCKEVRSSNGEALPCLNCAVTRRYF